MNTEADIETAAIDALVARTGCDRTCCSGRVGAILENDALNRETGQVPADYVRPLDLLVDEAADLDCRGYAECYA